VPRTFILRFDRGVLVVKKLIIDKNSTVREPVLKQEWLYLKRIGRGHA
jgi:hypothetical protein